MAVKERAAWGSHLEFILTLIGFAVGLGNVWRFPYLCYRNGGGAFIIPYFICLVVMGIPLFFMELSFGQFASLGPIKIWAINPAMKGLGFTMVIVSTFISLYYNVIIAVCIYYFFASMTSELPWSSCSDYSWASCYCRDPNMNSSDPDPWNMTRLECVRQFNETPFRKELVRSPSEDYFNNRVLHLSDSLGDTGSVRWDLALCLLLAWTIVFLVLTRGIKSLGKVVYVTAIFPYIILTILLVRAVTLDGHEMGVDFYLSPDLDKLSSADAWSDAAVQIFFSLSACSGGLIAMASYNEFNNNVLRDALMVPVINCLTSFFAGFVIFSTLGFMAHQKGVSVDDVAVDGPGLAFVAYPEALSQMPVAPLWSILFFLMMIMLGFSSQFSIVETVLTGLIDEFPWLMRGRGRTVAFRGCFCLLGFLLGLPMVTEAGFHLLDIVDNSTGGFPLLFVGFFETVAIIFVYGYVRFRRDIEMMIGDSGFVRVMFYYFAPMWICLTPLGLLAVILFRSIQYETKHFANPEVFPVWADVIWWLIVTGSLISIPAWFLGYGYRHGGKELLSEINAPTGKWRPMMASNCTGDYRKKVASVKNKSKKYSIDIDDVIALPGNSNQRNVDIPSGTTQANGTTVSDVYDNAAFDRSDMHEGQGQGQTGGQDEITRGFSYTLNHERL
ncbi:sodium- and chloride-dependent glycine transporter 1-like isoform X2 [Mya arenaria]|uniref:sodium- and chloride-dependent glycine transporter 1-like isoform X1 n=1 Tax=Mya arenaria TaxID=6604 RepID=UPI0022E9525B|nr:sodium- and chloride-dependent glycine transporter 1-like isoform X1 [Mya arenaria]XP_052813848.1 sodium- and chloride-dependent glycine transporter 1-like isoform X2 [Mya arenaria]